MLVPVRGVAVVTGEQTGDGRFLVPGGIQWAEMPLPFAWLVDGDQHADFSEHCPQLGTIHEVAPVGNEHRFRATVDDAIPAGAEALRRMREGSASLGHRFGVSIDPDDWAVQLCDMTGPAEDDMMVFLMASGSVPAGERFDWNSPMAALRAHLALTAAAGDGDPLQQGGQVIYEDSADSLIQRYTRMRVRGATMCAVAAFNRCYVELDDGSEWGSGESDAGTTSGAGSTTITITTGQTAEGEPPAVAAAAAAAPARTRVSLATPPAAWFDNPHLPFATPLTITNEGRLLGHIAAWNTCHTGYTDRCVPPPRGDYDRFHVGQTVCADGSTPAVGVFAWGIPHADLTLRLMEAWAHYSDSRYGFGRVCAGEDAYGIWFSGALNPGLSEDDVAVLRALSMSGDWRRDPTKARLGLIAALAVNFPGYPIPRQGLTASIGGEVIDVESWESPEASMRLEGELVEALVACGRVAPRASLTDCGCGSGAEQRVAGLEAQVAKQGRMLELLAPLAAAELDKRVN